MRRIVSAIVILLIHTVSWGQTNVFPESGKVGIGTTTPNRKLEVIDGSILVKSDPYASIGLERTNGGKISMGITSGGFQGFLLSVGSLKFLTDGDPSAKMFIEEDGDIGIGTSTPQYRLDLKAESKTHARFVGSFSGIQGIQVERSGGDNIRLVTNYSGYGGGLESSSALRFSVNGENINNPAIYVNTNGQTGIGTTSMGTHKLAVDGSIGAREIIVEAGSWSDFVFESDYKLRTLEEVENYISVNKHLPEIPSESEVTGNGVNLGEMDAKLLQKIEELTLYLIEQNKQNKEQQERIERLEQLNSELLDRLGNE